MKPLLATFLLLSTLPCAHAGETVLFDGTGLDAWEFAPGAWEIEEDGSLVCRMETSEGDDGTVKTRSMGYIWTKEDYGNFELTLSYKISEGANSGVFYRVDKKDPVHLGFEVQLMDDEGYQKTHGKLDARKLNGSFYEGKAPEAAPAKPPGQWNTFVLRCEGSRQTCLINGVQVFSVDIDEWTEVGKNPDGTPNKFKVAIKDKPRQGRIGLQNHGQVVWFRDIRVKSLD
ncbi:MAG: DUF1080 domain-containing protein [Verrucomicrobiae bacterium]|nr:DUF1080 domain-containing protein [Verrucomicrobiae bacterium]